ncbi:MAG TPA: EVE domain-containing protein [Thermomicrobiales bacterium]|nr:EVE domain-containing protein [Thermomicrobiales bacterium]
MPNYWINTISREHVQRGIEGGFTQADHGRPTTLRKLARGDLVAFYSPRTSYPDGAPLQRFTAIGRVIDDAPYQAEMTPTFHPWRRGWRFCRVKKPRSTISSARSPSSRTRSAGDIRFAAACFRSAKTISV